MLAVWPERCAGAAMECVGSRGGLRQRISPDCFAASEAGQILLLLLFRAEIHDGKCANTGVGSPCGTESSVFRNAVRDNGRRNFVELHAAILLGNIDPA